MLCVLPNNDVTVYLVSDDFGQLGRAFLETDLAEADREDLDRSELPLVSTAGRRPVKLVD